ncbi:MAG: hypothetical protein CMM03_12805 [Rhodopirellula sp.]|nr:hypothetical protein [Rhodopirellula sp.]|tara:strand:+ start:187 stop:1812 length:1626 start_codon:yes stop_codon:yes gene_type:complete
MSDMNDPNQDPNQESMASVPPPVPAAPVATAAPAAPSANPAEDPAADMESAHGSSFLWFQAVPSWMFSLAVHTVILVILGLMVLVTPEEEMPSLTSVMTKNDLIEEIVDDLSEPIDEPVEITPTETLEVETEVNPIEDVSEVEEIDIADDVEAPVAAVEFENIANQVAPQTDLLSSTESVTGSGLTGRGAEAKAAMVREYGGTKESEAAVAMALKWIANHQNPDGGWSFDHTADGRRNCTCGNIGTLKTSFNGATAMALLPFLGAGNTHKKGAYKKQVEAGLYYLTRSMKVNGATGDLTDAGGRMYSHGLCAITLTEAFAMTKDRQLMAPAQMSLNFITYAQDPVGGGWRYKPRQAGDTSVVGWQLMALKSGHMAYLNVPKNTIAGCYKFLDSVQANSGATYGYTTPGGGHATTAVGLLCRMYLGWKKDEPALVRGVETISKWAPSKSDMYYNYYATQVMRHHGGPLWDKWNKTMRDHLVATQELGKGQCENTGSWNMGAGHGARVGGRLYNTALATMILEVYYRHMPIYAQQAAEDDFPL